MFMVACFVAIPVFVGAECLDPNGYGECFSASPDAFSTPSGQSLAKPEAYGTKDSTILLVQSGSTTPIRSTYTYDQNFGWRYGNTGSNCFFDASLVLPPGVNQIVTAQMTMSHARRWLCSSVGHSACTGRTSNFFDSLS